MRTNCFDVHAAAYDDWFDGNQALYQIERETVRGVTPSIGGGFVVLRAVKVDVLVNNRFSDGFVKSSQAGGVNP